MDGDGVQRILLFDDVADGDTSNEREQFVDSGEHGATDNNVEALYWEDVSRLEEEAEDDQNTHYDIFDVWDGVEGPGGQEGEEEEEEPDDEYDEGAEEDGEVENVAGAENTSSVQNVALPLPYSKSEGKRPKRDREGNIIRY